jgi:UDP-N-acetylglucosamine--N-acetylmuramyl-(pentapeptide) pyrophosphoryl-undecaprenol N-acetylglucosamine transferase
MKLVIAGGGTGGHLFPGIAVAEALVDLVPGAEVLFVGTERGIEKRAVPKAGFSLATIEIAGLKGMSLTRKLGTLTRLPSSIWQSRKILQNFGPDAVLGVGGYASGPVLLAARLMGIPTAICEQNSVPGLTNRVLGRLVRRVFATFQHSAQFFPPHAFLLAGNPVRQAFSALQSEAGADAASSGAPHRILVLGGSQGARPLNEVLPEAGAWLRENGVEATIVHQTGKNELDAVRARYEATGIDAEAVSFIDDMVSAYRNADLVVCRAGATTCSELAIAGRPAIFVPFPHATDDHQTLNAREFSDAGAGMLFPQRDLNPEKMGQAIKDLLEDPEARQAMARNVRTLARPEAARHIAEAARSGFGGGRP